MKQFLEIHIENTNSCGYKCVMCPRDQQTRKIGFMSVEDFSFLLGRLGPFEGNFHLHGFGEPLLDRQLGKKITLLKEKFPSCGAQIFSTLGVKVKEEAFAELADAGLNSLGISLYGFTQEAYKGIHGYDGFALVKRNLQLLSEAMRRPNASLSATVKIPGRAVVSTLPIADSGERAAFCSWIQELGFKIKEWSYVHNYGDGRNYNAPNQEKMCPVINGMRKNILNITWDLNVIPCCYDFNATIRFGNLRENTLEEIFSSPEYFRFVLAHKMNDLSAYPVCQNCEKNDYE